MRLSLVAPSELTENKNWKTHPEAQREALEKAMEALGWTMPLLANETSGRLIDGHLRLDIAREKGLELVPVVFLELDERGELLALATLDAIRGMAEWDYSLLWKVISSIEEKPLRAAIDDILPEELKAILMNADKRENKNNTDGAGMDTDAGELAIEFSSEQWADISLWSFRFDRRQPIQEFIVAAVEAAA